ncbi:MAG: serine/threonine protein kinase, partial [Acidobacteriota bacterium]
MSDDRPDPISATIIVADALELEGDALRSYLDAVCGDDAVLREEVEALLDVAGERFTDDFLETPAVELLEDVRRAPPEPPRRIGDFELVRRLGEGGMGTVYLAEQRRPVERRVALKLIKAGMDGAQVLARFEAERQALALMDHDNVAAVHDA